MAKHIGIVACSYEGASLCYRTICNEGSRYLGEHAHPEVTLHNLPLSDYMTCIRDDDWQGVARLMLLSSEKLYRAGAEFLVSPDNTIHQAFSFVEEKSPLPWLHIGRVVAQSAEDNNYLKLGLLGTRFLMEGPVYPEVLSGKGISCIVPEEEHRVMINEIIFNELVYGIIAKSSKSFFISVVKYLKEQGCEAVILGCTEIPLIVLPEESPLPVLDSTRLLARAALQFSLGDTATVGTPDRML